MHVDSTVYNDCYTCMSNSFSLVIHFPNSLLWTACYNLLPEVVSFWLVHVVDFLAIQ